jgi:hypothetical protein
MLFYAALVPAFFLVFTMSCDSGDIVPFRKTENDKHISVGATFRLSGTGRIGQRYQLIFGAFEGDARSPVVWTTLVDPKEDVLQTVSLSSVPPTATTVKLSLFTTGKKAVYDFFVYDVSRATEPVDIPATPVELLIRYDRVQELFNLNCTACHGTAPGAAGLLLSTGESYNHLVNRPAKNSAKLLVEPSNVRASFLMDVLTNSIPPHGSYLYADDLNLIEAWIETGAELN